METIQGHALVASPYLTDPNFLRSVVYVLRHDEEGAVGLLLNRPLSTKVGSLLEHLTGTPIQNDAPVYNGGPVDGPLMMLQQSRDEDGNLLIHVASDQDRILQITAAPDPSVEDYRIFDGYSGWGAGQLDAELQSGGWIVWDIQPKQVFEDPDELWQSAIRQIGRDILALGIDPSKMPEDPAFN